MISPLHTFFIILDYLLIQRFTNPKAFEITENNMTKVQLSCTAQITLYQNAFTPSRKGFIEETCNMQFISRAFHVVQLSLDYFTKM